MWSPRFEGDICSLGWSLLDWWADHLASPTDESEPFILTDEQARIVLRWYEVDPRTGRRFVHRRGASRRSKGWGKSPLEAAKALAELAAEVVPDGFDASGQPVGKPWGSPGVPTPWVQIAAVSEDQTDNTYSSVYEFLNANDGSAADALRIDHGLTRCFLRDRPGKLEPVTAAAGSREGQRVTYAVKDETHLWLPTNGGVKLSRTLNRNVAKMGGRSYETTNSFVPGENSVAELTHIAVEKGEPGIFYDAVEAPPVKEDDPDDRLREALAVAYGDARWVDLGRLVQEIRDSATPWDDAARFYFNWNQDNRLKAVTKARWSDLARVDVGDIPAGARVGLGFDGSISGDATALLGCTLIDGVPHGFEVEVWQRPDNAPPTWRIPRTEVDYRVREAFGYWDVGLMLCDPPKWQTEIEAWAEEFGEDRVAFFDTNVPTRMARACDRFLIHVEAGTYSHDDADTTTAHVLAMHKKKVRVRDEDDDGRTKFVFVKGPDRLKIDAGIGAVLALEACMTMPDAPAPVMPLVAWR